MSSTTSNTSHLRHVNVTTTSTSSTGIIILPPARDGDGDSIAAFGKTVFAVAFATYVFLGLIYLIKNHALLARRGRREITSSSSSSSSTDASSSSLPTHDRSRSSRGMLSSSSLRCTDLIFAIRLFLFDIVTSSSDDGHDHVDHRASGILSRREYYSDERREYRSWSVSQVARWANMRLHRDRKRSTEDENLTLRTTRTRGMGSYFDSPRRDEYDERMAIRTAITALKDQRIHGKSLEFLTLDRLLEFGLAFGVAVDLMSCLDDLIRNNNDNNNRISHEDDQEVALERFPAWYEGSRQDNTKEDITSMGDEEMELTERARRIMKDRFGLTLPTLRGQEEVPSDVKYDPENDSQRCTSAGNSSLKICQEGTGTTAIAPNNDNSNDRNANAARGRPTKNVIEEMISIMPPHVRAVAERRPDLMYKLFSERKEPHSSVLRQESHQRTISLQSEDRIGIDQESVCLLRRRTYSGKIDASS
ncbi:hypothetical protein ACHAW5_007765 [Stephanodiscus triporus]|uniref:Uncharacterized protein n=1 Tax=Stephanodiscus triporus TaxID=2934178 RepID=A0ABD3MPY7_9STRA